jgi:FkbM family methyltransferase
MSNVVERTKRAIGRTRAYPYLKDLQERASRDRRADRGRRIAFYRQFVGAQGLAFDVGANMGNRTDALLALGARVVAVEPQPICISTLLRRFGTNPQLTVIPAGLGEVPGTATLHLATNHVLSSMSKDFMARTAYENNHWVSTQQVRVTTLDTLIDVFGIPDFCKIDVEGFETAVLRGLSRPIAALSIEHNPPTADATIECLQLIHALSSDYQFAFSEGESMLLDGRGWLPAPEAVALAGSSELRFGDFYARRS